MLYDPKWKPIEEVVITRDDLTESQTWALLRVREALKSGEISERQFNMEQTYRKDSCGTVGCIGGWMGIFTALAEGFTENEIHYGEDLDFGSERHSNMQKCFAPIDGASGEVANIFRGLFYPEAVVGECKYYFGYKSTPEDGVKAIENFLIGEKYPWKDWNGSTEFDDKCPIETDGAARTIENLLLGHRAC